MDTAGIRDAFGRGTAGGRGTANTSVRPRAAVRIARTVAALLASLLALLLVLLLLGAFVPALPGRVWIVGLVLSGQYPLHLALFALAGLALAVTARRAGLVRWGRILTVVTSVCAAGALFIAGVQLRAAWQEGTNVAWGDVFTEVAYPDVEPDETKTFARPSGAALDVDAYLPEPGHGRTPAVVLAHAGGFHTFDKSDLRGTGRWLADHGVAAFAIDYRLASPSSATWNKAPQDVVCALSWVRANAARLNVEPSRISVGGMSAGGALALGAAYRLADGSISSSCGRTPPPPASVIGFYPAEDLHRMWKADADGSRRAANWFTGGTPEQYPARYRETSPTSQVRAGLMPTLLVVGDRDHSVPVRNINGFGASLKRHGADARVKVLPFSEHAFDDAYGSIVSQASRRVLLDFLTSERRE